MATLREIYESAHREGNVGTDLTWASGEHSFTVHGRCHFSFDTNTRFVSYFVTEPDWQTKVSVLMSSPEEACAQTDQSVEVSMGNPTLGIEMQKSRDLRFAGRVYLYVEALVTEEDRADLLREGNERGLSIELRDLTWLHSYNASTRPMAFLSHDSRDKEDVARPLVSALGRLGCSVWYDEYSLKVGDSLSESIDRGIREAPKCIVLLSPNFMSNPGWSKAEFAAIMNRHIHEGDVILPVWHDVAYNDVYSYSSFLVDVKASKTRSGVESVAGELASVLQDRR
jgi:hypothetical protein